jgi:hypothetical protein
VNSQSSQHPPHAHIHARMVTDCKSTLDFRVFLYHVSFIISIDLLCFSVVVVVVICSLVLCTPRVCSLAALPTFFFLSFYPAIPSVLVRLSAWLCTHAPPFSHSHSSDRPTVVLIAFQILTIDTCSQRYWLWILYVSVARFLSFLIREYIINIDLSACDSGIQVCRLHDGK